MNHTKYIKTLEVQRWQKRKNLGYVIPVILFVIFSVRTLPGWLFQGLSVDLPVWLTIAFMSIILSVPCWLIWNAVCYQLWRNALNRTTFQSIADLDYYREKLTGMSPVLISLLTDLKTERKKDATAMLLKLQLQGYVTIDNGKISVNDTDQGKLSNSDRLFLNHLKINPQLSQETLIDFSDWEQEALREAQSSQFFQQKKKHNHDKGSQIGCLPWLLSLGVILICYFNKDFQYVSKLFTQVEEFSAVESNEYFMQMISKDPHFLYGVLWCVLGGIAVFFFLWYPISAVVRGFIQTSAENKIKIQRTKQGMEYTEYIYGLKNFIHDFSNLSEANKDQLVLWDDFLIYAILLEENTQILDEIFKRKHRDPREICF